MKAFFLFGSNHVGFVRTLVSICIPPGNTKDVG